MKKLFSRYGAYAIAIAAVVGVFLISIPSCGCGGPATRRVLAISNIKQLATSLSIYVDDYDGVYPGVRDQNSFRNVVGPYQGGKDQIQDLPRYKVRAEYNLHLANVDGHKLTSPEEVVTLSSPFAQSEKDPITFTIASFADSHTRAIPIDKWNADYADLLDRNYPRVSQAFLPAAP